MKIKHLAGAAALLPLAACSQKAAQQPNIVFFLVDDFGWVDSSVQYGDEVYPYNLRYKQRLRLRRLHAHTHQHYDRYERSPHAHHQLDLRSA